MVLRLWYAPRRKFFDTLADDRLVKYTPLPQRGSTNGGARRSGAATGKKLFYMRSMAGSWPSPFVSLPTHRQSRQAHQFRCSPRVWAEFLSYPYQPAIRRLSRWPEVPDDTIIDEVSSPITLILKLVPNTSRIAWQHCLSRVHAGSGEALEEFVGRGARYRLKSPGFTLR